MGGDEKPKYTGNYIIRRDWIVGRFKGKRGGLCKEQGGRVFLRDELILQCTSCFNS